MPTLRHHKFEHPAGKPGSLACKCGRGFASTVHLCGLEFPATKKGVVYPRGAVCNRPYGHGGSHARA
jgi:hypothetical protein